MADTLAVAGLTVLRLSDARAGPSVSGLCLALAFTTLPRMAWQFYLFLRTDIYHLITTATGCMDLDTAARALIANRVNGLLGRRDRLRDERDWGPAISGSRAGTRRCWCRLRLDAGHARAGARRRSCGASGIPRCCSALTLSQLAVALALALRERRARPEGETT